MCTQHVVSEVMQTGCMQKQHIVVQSAHYCAVTKPVHLPAAAGERCLPVGCPHGLQFCRAQIPWESQACCLSGACLLSQLPEVPPELADAESAGVKLSDQCNIGAHC